MSARFFVAAAVGIAVGTVSGGTLGFQAFSLAYGLGGFLDPSQKVQGPRLDDLKAPSAAYGAPIAYVEGHPRLAGNIVWASDKREIATTTSQGKGGPGVDSTQFTYEMDMLIVLSENPGFAPRRCWSNGELVWTRADESSADSLAASAETISWREIRPYKGLVGQLPDPDYEAVVGVGNAPAYRGRSSVFIKGLNLGGGGYVPVLTFELTKSEPSGELTVRELYTVSSGDGMLLSGVAAFVGLPTHTIYLPNYTASYGNQQYQIVTDGQHVGFGSFPGFPEFVGNYPQLNFLDGQSDASYWLARGSIGTPPFQYSEMFDSAGFTFKSGHPDEGGGQTLGDADVTTGYSRSNGATLLFTQEGFGAGAVYGVSFGLDNGGIVHTGYRVKSAVFFDGYWRLLNEAFGGFIDTFTGGSVVTGTIPDPRSTNAAVLLVDSQTGELCMFESTTVKKWDGTTWSVIIFGIPAAQQPGPNNLGASITGGVLTVIKWISAIANPTTFTAWALGPAESLGLADSPLDEVVLEQCLRAGLAADQVDVTQLEGKFVRSMAISQISSPRTVIDSLAAAYLFEAVESEKLRFVLRGGAAVATIAYADLGASAGDDSAEPLPIRRANDIELPAKVIVTYANVDDDYQDGNEAADRGVTDSNTVAAVQIALGLTPTEAKRIADSQVADIAASVLSIGPLALTKHWSKLEPTDPVLIEKRDGSLIRARLQKRTDAGGMLTLEAVVDDATVIDSVATTGGGYTNSTTVTQPSPTEVELLDIPILRDQDDDKGLYVAAKWSRGAGYTFFQSQDSTSYSALFNSTAKSTFGAVIGAIQDWNGGATFDGRSSITVDVGEGQLFSVASGDALIDGTANVALIGDEIVQFFKATMISAGVYILRGFLRGRRGTEAFTSGHATGERFVLLDASLRRIPTNVYYKAVTSGLKLANSAAHPLPAFANVGGRLFSLVDPRAERLEDDSIKISWQRRTRLAATYGGTVGELVPVGESTEAYLVVVQKDTGSGYVPYRNLIVGAGLLSNNPDIQGLQYGGPSVVYSADRQTTDFGALQSQLHITITQLEGANGNNTPGQQFVMNVG